MKTRYIIPLLIAAISQSAALASDNSYWTNVDASIQRMVHGDRYMDYWANVDASFAHLFGHEPYPGPVAANVQRGVADPVERLLHAMGRGETASVAAGTSGYWANVDASFRNLLSREPYYGETGVTVARGEKDPVETRLHAMTRGEPEDAGTTLASRQIENGQQTH